MTRHLCFVMSGGRTGTQFLGHLLSEVIEDCWSEHEPDVFDGFGAVTARRIQEFGLWHMVFGRILGLTGIRAAGTRYLIGQIERDEVIRKVQRERADYHAGKANSLLIESYPQWWMFAQDLPAIYPDAKMIGIIRDPRGWICSRLAHQNRQGRRHWTHYFPPGIITPARVHDQHWEKRWNEIGAVGRLAWEWQFINKRLSKAIKDQTNARMFRYEDLFNSSDSRIDELVTFAASYPDRTFKTGDLAPYLTERLNASTSTGQEWKLWTDEQCQIVDELCGDVMVQYGYDPLSGSKVE